MQNKLFLISGPSGVGKRTLIETFIDDEQLNLCYSISMTTRKKREDEVNNVNYYFVSHEDFDKAIQNHEMLEWAEFAGNKYGTRKSEIKRIFDSNKSVLLEIEIQGALQIFENTKKEDLVSIFIAPPSINDLVERLNKRGTETQEEKDHRIAIAAKELEYKSKYDYVVINDDVDRAAQEIRNIILKEQNEN